MIDQKYIDMIIDRVDIEKVVSGYVGDMKHKGHRSWACCPFHQEKTPSFCVDTLKNLWHCYGSCQDGGTVIKFIEKIENLPFPLAVKKLLKEELHIDIQDADIQSTPEEEAKQKKLESMRIINDYLSQWFYQQLWQNTPNSLAAKDYMLNRWNEEYCKEQRIGFAPADGRKILEYCEKKGLNFDIMQEMGILKMSEKTHSLYCVYRNRLMIPIRDRYSNIIGFTARTMDAEDDRKYINSSESELYVKSRSIFGIDQAMNAARRQEKMFLVEGGPDVMKLQSVGILNTIASLGGAWTKEQFMELRHYRMQNCTLCFIPDSDIPKAGERLGAGFKNVLKNGALAMECGFTVSVREIPNDFEAEHPKKTDPDEYVKRDTDLAGLTEKEFLLWYLEKSLDREATTEDRQKVINSVCDLLVCIKDEDLQETYLSKLAHYDGTKQLWRNAFNSAKRRKQEKLSSRNKRGDIDMLRQFGFIEKHNSYYGATKDGDENQWSNFCLKPLFHIKDDLRPVRLFEINNSEEEDRPEIIELDMEVLTSSKSLRKKLLGQGNYIWMAGDQELIKLQSYLAKVTETAVEIKQLGWQKEGFYAFSNGALEDSEWHDTDKMGIVRLKVGKFYLPALSQLYNTSKELYVNERKFQLTRYSNMSLNEYFTKICRVFGPNAKIALTFYMASLFADIIRQRGVKIPLLNLFGPPGSGKTELARTLMGFFQTDYDPPNIESSIPSLADAVASVSNALVFLDEYKNGIDIKKLQFLKDIWGGVGRMRMNMDKDKKREQARVDSAVIMCGQEMPTADPALFTRLIYLTYDKHSFSEQERQEYADLMHWRMLGASHITIEILKHRDKFEASFGAAWRKAESDVKYALRGEGAIVDRIQGNWTVLLATYIALEDALHLPFTYDDLLEISTKGILRQNEMSASVDEVAGFWNIISSAIQKGILVKDQDYKIRYKEKLRTSKQREEIELGKSTPILMVRRNIMLSTYRELGRRMDEQVLPQESIQHYLEITPEYYGYTTSPERFKKFNANGLAEREEILDAQGKCVGYRTVWNQDRPMCFNYEQVSQKYGIILDTYSGGENDKLPRPEPDEGQLFGQGEDDAPF
jgi:DNA primase catalytic core